MRFLGFVSTLLLLAATSAHAQVNNFNQDTKFCSGRPWIDVTCGINGADPTGSADSTTAINNTVTAAITSGSPVFFPAGTYKITSKLTWDYQGQAGNGFEVISRGAVIDGRTIVSGNVLQIQCSGGTTISPTVCHGLRITGQLTVQGTTNAYVVVLGKTDFSDRHDGATIEHLIVVNNNNNSNAGAIQANYLTNGNLWLSGTTPGGSSSVGAVALEQVQSSKISGYGSALGASAPAQLVENGSSVGNSFAGFGYDPNTNTCISVTSSAAQRNAWLVPYLPCTTAFNGNSNQQNVLLGPTFAGTNMGPTSGGAALVGRGSLNRYSAPTVASRTLIGADDGTIFSSANATGASTQYTASSLPVTLPDPSVVGSGWTVGFVSDSNKAVVATAPAGKFILSANLQLSSLILAQSGANNGNFQTAVLTSDGSNFRLVHISQGGALINQLEMTYPGATWEYPGGPGYQVTAADNGASISSNSSGGGLTVTLPQTTTLVAGWSVALSHDGNNQITVNVNGTSGGQIIRQSTGLSVTAFKTLYNGQVVRLQFDGTNFREGNQPAPQLPVDVRLYGADPTGVADSAPAFQAAYNANVGCVKIPAGTYLINSQISITAQPPCFIGEYWSETGLQSGTWLKITNTSITPFYISNLSTAGAGKFKDIAIYEQQPSPAPGWAPSNYPYVFDCVSAPGELQFDNIYIFNVSRGFSLTGNCARTTFGRIRGQPLITGIFVDGALDILHGDGSIEFWVYWSADPNVLAYMQANADGIYLLRADGPLFNQVFALGYRSAIRLGVSGLGMTSTLHVSMLYADVVKYGILIQSPAGSAPFGFIDSFLANAVHLDGSALPGGECVRYEGPGLLQIANFTCFAAGDSGVDEANPSGGSLFYASNAVMDNFNENNNGSAAFNAGQTTVFGAYNLISIGSTPAIGGHFNGGPIFTKTNGIYALPGFNNTSLTAVNNGQYAFMNFSPISTLLLHETSSIGTATISLPAAAAAQRAVLTSDNPISTLQIIPQVGDPPYPVNGADPFVTSFGSTFGKLTCDFIGAGVTPGQWVCR